MMKLANLADQHVEELAALDAIDAGKLYGFGKMIDIPGAIACLRYYAGVADKIHGEVLKMSRDLFGYTLREPIGVVGHIIPWNFPSNMFFMKVAPALAAGCTIVIKPAEQTPLSALFYAELVRQVMYLTHCQNRFHFCTSNLLSERKRQWFDTQCLCFDVSNNYLILRIMVNQGKQLTTK